ncbi:epoxide hydrolase [Asanoa sp. WMMD1127]|uniref:epoxide hydrolase family protein n=1 Tax=Asanoa sp. WMMD1127 TaxID=3016107 RepID=UPI002415D545|nr:epoxide hydrolase family protein [Asanoa sp. WMMD1127]MDG4826038.1 epoxide hydrolase [Asanoa sp. WMMD1127]
MRPFRFHAPQKDLDDLRERLATTRWPPTDTAGLRELIEHWRTDFDWPTQERRLNQPDQFTADVDGHTVHFVHLRSRATNPIPLLLTHGWPSSYAEFLPLLPLLTDTFDVVVPSLPGFGFTPGPPGRHLIRETPRLWTTLMRDVLGYDRFGAHGTDIGAYVTNRMALDFPEPLIGIHVTAVAEPDTTSAPLTDEEREYLERRARNHERDQAYAHLQRSDPTTIGYALHDSPVALAAWIADKWRRWSDDEPDADDLLTTVTLYWLTGTALSSCHAYADLGLATAAVPPAADLYPDAPPGADGRPLPKRITPPTAVIRTPNFDAPRTWAERAYADLRRWTRLDRGGHFLATEQPHLLAQDLEAFFQNAR